MGKCAGAVPTIADAFPCAFCLKRPGPTRYELDGRIYCSPLCAARDSGPVDVAQQLELDASGYDPLKSYHEGATAEPTPDAAMTHAGWIVLVNEQPVSAHRWWIMAFINACLSGGEVAKWWTTDATEPGDS